MIYRRLYREDNSIIDQSQIKSFHYHIQSNQNGNLRPGNVISSFIEVELFTSGGNLPDIGETIWYYRGYDNNDGFIQNHFLNPPEYFPRGSFAVFEKHISSNGDVCTIIAYDDLKLLEKSYAERLIELKESGAFPMTAIDLLSDAVSYAGLTLDHQGIVFGISVNSFYSDNLTCRDVVASICELVGNYAYIITPGTVGITGDYRLTRIAPYYNNDRYIVCPTDQVEYRDDDDNVLIPAYYKQDGLTVSDYEVQTVDDVFIYNSSGILLGRTFNSNDPQNIYYITDNIIANNCVLDDPITVHGINLQGRWNTAADSIYNRLNSVLPYRPMSIQMFPFRCPYERISTAHVVDKNGSRYTIPVMNIDEDNYGVTISSFGQNETQNFTNEFVTADQRATSLDIRLNNLQQESSDLAEIVGDGSLSGFTATDLTGAANELMTDKVSKSGDTMTGALNLDIPLAIASGGTESTNAADALAALYGLSKLAVYYNASAGTVIDTATDGVMLVATSASVNASLYNALGDTFSYIIQVFFGNISSTSARAQIAIPYTGTVTKIAWRVYRSGWGTWHVIRTGDETITGITVPQSATGVATMPSVSAVRTGNTVQVTVSNITLDATPPSNWANIATGLPIPSEAFYTHFISANGRSTTQLRIRVTTSGQLQVAYGQGNATYSSSLIYVCDD